MKTNRCAAGVQLPTGGGRSLRRFLPRALIAALAGAFATAATAATMPVSVPLGSRTNLLIAPARVAADAQGRLYVSEPAAGRVVVYDAFGLVSSVKTGLSNPLGLAVDAAGRIYVGEADLHCVSVFDQDWQFLSKLGAGDGEFNLPGHIAVDPVDGNVLVSDGLANVVKVYTNGALAFAFGGYGITNGVFDFCAGLAVTPDEIYVVDQNNNRAQVFSRTGGYLRQFSISASMGGANGRCQGAWADNAGRLYFSDVYQGYVRVYATNGVKLGNLASYGELDGQLRSPVDVAFDSCNRMVVAAPNNGRVELYGIDGFIHVSATPGANFAASGTDLILSAMISGAGSFSYQWRCNGTNLVDGGNVSGATGAILTVSGIGTSQGGSYSVSITGTNGALDLTASRLLVQAPPVIVQPPAPQTVAQGATATFTVGAAGDDLRYQWTRDLEPLPGATNASLVLPGVMPDNEGGYGVLVRNLVGSTASVEVALSVIEPPVIELHPSDVVVIRGEYAVFQSLASGSGLVYQWVQNGVPLLGEDSSELHIQAAEAVNAGTYWAVVTNEAGSVSTDPAVLNVLIPPATNLVSSLTQIPDGSLEIMLEAESGFDYALDYSTNLLDWTRVAAITNAPSNFFYLDVEHSNDLQRFYRLRWNY